MPKAFPLFNPDARDVFGGAEVDLYYLSTELAKDKDFDVSFITADYGQEKIKIIENIRIIKSLNFKNNPLIGALKIWHAMKKADADVYILKTASPGSPLVATFCLFHKKFFTYRAASAQECDGTYIQKHFILGKAFKWSLRKAKLVLTQNELDRKNLQSTFDISAITIPNGHRLNQLRDVGRDIILWVGRSAQVKRAELFIKLAEQVPDEKFTLICQQATGDENYEQLVRRAKAVKNLDFIERVPFAEVDSHFQRAKVFVNTSDSEGFPNTFIQACRAATPILSLNVNPDGFLDKHKCGICANGDWEKFVRDCKILTEPSTIKEYGRNGRRYVEQNHDIKKIVEQYKDLFRQLVDQS
jgi:glycosyltransferase involved in cell wall biosynthesis